MLQNIEQERLYSGGKSLNLTKSLLRTLKDLRFPPTYKLQLLACNSFVDTRWRHRTPVSEMKDCVNHNLASIVNTMFASVFIATKCIVVLWRDLGECCAPVGLHYNEGTLSLMNQSFFKMRSKPTWSISQRGLVFIILYRKQTYPLFWRETAFSYSHWHTNILEKIVQNKFSQCLCLLTCRNARDPWRIVSPKAFNVLASSCSSGLISLGKDWRHHYHIYFPWCCRIVFPRDQVVSLSVNGLQ